MSIPNETKPTDIFGLPDEEFAKLNGPPGAASSGSGEGDGDDPPPPPSGDNQDPPPPPVPPKEGEGDPPAPGGENQDPPNNEGGDPPPPPPAGESGDGKPPAPPAGGKEGESGNLPQDKSKEGQPPPAPAGEQAPPDYKAFYEKVMSPLRANGKTIDLKTPDEAIQLMQMGANYTRKMQALAPHRKFLLMLENNQLLDEGKLNFLIDLDKKSPEAIKKLLKDANMDPREIDLEDPNAKPYLEGNHRVTDESVAFQTVLDDLSSTLEGKATLQEIQTHWDQASKEVLWKQPDTMAIIHSQRETGIYDRIATELNRQRTLGMIPANVPFLAAYKHVGDQIAAAGGFKDLEPQAPEPPITPTPPTPPAQPVAVRVQQPKTPTNGEKANAASPPRSTPAKTDTSVNPLALSDEDFNKQFSAFKNRL